MLVGFGLGRFGSAVSNERPESSVLVVLAAKGRCITTKSLFSPKCYIVKYKISHKTYRVFYTAIILLLSYASSVAKIHK